MTKDIYLNFLGQLLREHYNSIKETGSASSDSQQFITGYLTAARRLNAVYQKEMNYPAASYGVSKASIRNRPFEASFGEYYPERLK